MAHRTNRDERVVAAFVELTGKSPEGVWIAPGRVNLIGEHTDYNDGLALPAAIDRFAVVAAALRDDGVVRCASVQMAGVETVAIRDVAPGALRERWSAYPLGALWGLGQAGAAIPGLDIVVDSDIPVGGGLASSAALEVATAIAVTELSAQPMRALDVARCCMAGERAIAGAPTGIMDQLATLDGRRGHAVRIDCRALTRDLVPFDPSSVSLCLLVIDTAVRHANSAAAYRTRRAQSARAARMLGVTSLREATLVDAESGLDGVLRRRARHVVTENARVDEVVAALRTGRVCDVGPILDAGHASLRDDYQVSCAELDVAVAAARRGGALGARMTGGGFGGCAIALTPSGRIDAVTEAVTDAFAEHEYGPPGVFAVDTADGARRVA